MELREFAKTEFPKIFSENKNLVDIRWINEENDDDGIVQIETFLEFADYDYSYYSIKEFFVELFIGDNGEIQSRLVLKVEEVS
jgi:hypothetical protein